MGLKKLKFGRKRIPLPPPQGQLRQPGFGYKDVAKTIDFTDEITSWTNSVISICDYINETSEEAKQSNTDFYFLFFSGIKLKQL